jgi:hypothetical protein
MEKDRDVNDEPEPMVFDEVLLLEKSLVNL